MLNADDCGRRYQDFFSCHLSEDSHPFGSKSRHFGGPADGPIEIVAP